MFLDQRLYWYHSQLVPKAHADAVITVLVRDAQPVVITAAPGTDLTGVFLTKKHRSAGDAVDAGVSVDHEAGSVIADQIENAVLIEAARLLRVDSAVSVMTRVSLLAWAVAVTAVITAELTRFRTATTIGTGQAPRTGLTVTTVASEVDDARVVGL